MPEPAAAILLVDDDRELAALMSEYFREQGFEITAAFNGPDGLRAARGDRYDLILLDVMMPGFDGFEFLRRLRAQSDIPVLMLTARTEASSRVLGLETGADDYLPKPFDPLELVARVRAILRRSRGPETRALEFSGVRLEPATRRVFHKGKPIDVTSVEYDILETLMRSAGRVVSRDDLAQRLYQRNSTPLDRSIDVHVSHLRKKLADGPDLIRTVRGVGYQFAAE
ncbi:MAG: response regulator transcription factor [Bryobacteraceae bacterium]|nr:response regulator transcription factor [Bryobacteraceae bacterium]